MYLKTTSIRLIQIKKINKFILLKKSKKINKM